MEYHTRKEQDYDETKMPNKFTLHSINKEKSLEIFKQRKIQLTDFWGNCSLKIGCRNDDRTS